MHALEMELDLLIYYNFDHLIISMEDAVETGEVSSSSFQMYYNLKSQNNVLIYSGIVQG